VLYQNGHMQFSKGWSQQIDKLNVGERNKMNHFEALERETVR